MHNIIIFGGSFDPIHEGHLTLIKKMSELGNISKFYLIPAGEHPENKNFFFSSSERLLMMKVCLNLLSKDEKKKWGIDHLNLLDIFPCSILEREILNPQVSYTIHTLEYIRSLHPIDKLHLLVGGDQAMKFSSWLESSKIAELATLWVYPRKDMIPDSNFDWNVLDLELQDISSTDIKELIMKKDSLEHKKIPICLQYLIPKILNKRK